jgi:hypothetical protein
MKLENIAKVRRLAAVAVAANLAVALLAALVLPAELMVVLPVVALTLPLLTTSLVERFAQRTLGAALPS